MKPDKVLVAVLLMVSIFFLRWIPKDGGIQTPAEKKIQALESISHPVISENPTATFLKEKKLAGILQVSHLIILN